MTTRPQSIYYVDRALAILKADDDDDDDLTISSDYESDEEEECSKVGDETTNSAVEYRSKSVMVFEESMFETDSLHLVRERLPIRKATTSDDTLSLSEDESDYESDIDSMCGSDPPKSQDEKHNRPQIDQLVDDLLLISEKRSRNRNQRRYMMKAFQNKTRF